MEERYFWIGTDQEQVSPVNADEVKGYYGTVEEAELGAIRDCLNNDWPYEVYAVYQSIGAYTRQPHLGEYRLVRLGRFSNVRFSGIAWEKPEG